MAIPSYAMLQSMVEQGTMVRARQGNEELTIKKDGNQYLLIYAIGIEPINVLTMASIDNVMGVVEKFAPIDQWQHLSTNHYTPDLQD